MPEELSKEDRIKKANLSLKDIVRRWRKEKDEAKSDRLWELVIEADKRLSIAKAEALNLPNGVCPACAGTRLLIIEDHNDDIKICKKCGWSNKDDLRKVIKIIAHNTSHYKK